MEGNQASIGVTSDAAKIVRSAQRIKRLKESLAKNEAKGNKGKCEELKAEIDRRQSDMAAIKEAIESAEAE